MDGEHLRELFPDHPDFLITQVSMETVAVTIEATVTIPTAECPSCGCSSGRVHSRYTRRVKDQPCRGRELQLIITARKFLCLNANCSQHIFCERLPSLVSTHARTTDPLTESHRSLGFSLGGEAGSRLARRLSMPTSPDTLLRRIKSAPEPEMNKPRYVGIDDWSYKRGRTYGTILIDLEQRRVIDILPGRDGEALKVWLRHNPQVELISRDRWAAYANAATESAPQARQVTDRWHLLKNLREAVERLFDRKYGALKEAIGPLTNNVTTENKPVPENSTRVSRHALPVIKVTPRQEARQAKQRRRMERYDLVRRLHGEGKSQLAIARELRMTRETIRHYLNSDHCPDWRSRKGRPTTVSPFHAEIDRELQSGCTNASKLHRQLLAHGSSASYYSVRRFVRRRCTELGLKRDREAAPPERKPRIPTARQMAFQWVRKSQDREVDEEARMNALRQCDEFREAIHLADRFAAMIRREQAETLNNWLDQAQQSRCPEIATFAKGLRQDQSAVQAAMSEPYNNGPVEGSVNRLKTIKRQMYGRASFALLRARVRAVT